MVLDHEIKSNILIWKISLFQWPWWILFFVESHQNLYRNLWILFEHLHRYDHVLSFESMSPIHLHQWILIRIISMFSRFGGSTGAVTEICRSKFKTKQDKDTYWTHLSSYLNWSKLDSLSVSRSWRQMYFSTQWVLLIDYSNHQFQFLYQNIENETLSSIFFVLSKIVWEWWLIYDRNDSAWPRGQVIATWRRQKCHEECCCRYDFILILHTVCNIPKVKPMAIVDKIENVFILKYC